MRCDATDLLGGLFDQVYPLVELSQLVVTRRRVGEDLNTVEAHVNVRATSRELQSASETAAISPPADHPPCRCEELLAELYANHRVLRSHHSVTEWHRRLRCDSALSSMFKDIDVPVR